MSQIVSCSKDSIARAAIILKQGGLVGMPTETVYGLAANACDGKAVARIFEAKGRPSFNPLISHFATARDIEAHAHMDERAQMLAQRFWPGPLTLILPRKENSTISALACADLPTLAVRVPGHPDARALIKAAGVPLAAPSANISGTLSPTRAIHVAEGLGDKVDLILAGGASEVGLESTVIDLSGPEVHLLRPGGISAEEISDALGGTPIHQPDENSEIKSPGQLLKHYAPTTPMRLNAIDLAPDEALLGFGSLRFMGIRGGGAALDLPDDRVRNLSEGQDLHEAAANLFAMIRELDQSGAQAIAVMNIPDQGLGIAINDRLKRAAS